MLKDISIDDREEKPPSITEATISTVAPLNASMLVESPLADLPKSPLTPTLSKAQRKPSRDQSKTRKVLSREPSNLSDKSFGMVSREPSFVYDTTVEAFSTHGAYIDDEDDEVFYSKEPEPLDDKDEPHGISIIGKLVLSPNLEKGGLDVNEEVITSSSPAKVDRLFLTDYAQGSYEEGSPLQHKHDEGGQIPSKHDRKVSSGSAEEKISTTPEAEKYFLKREKSFMKKVARGQIETLAVDISDFCSIEKSTSGSELSVLPVTPLFNASEIEITNLDSVMVDNQLTVKPADGRSSYEALYSPCSEFDDIEEETERSQTVPYMLSELGDDSSRDLISKVIPEYVSSSEGLECMSSTEQEFIADDGSVHRFSGVTMRTSQHRNSQQYSDQFHGPVRWSAPPGSLEPHPSLCPPEEFIIHLSNVAELGMSGNGGLVEGGHLSVSGEQHWQNLRILPQSNELTVQQVPEFDQDQLTQTPKNNEEDV